MRPLLYHHCCIGKRAETVRDKVMSPKLDSRSLSTDHALLYCLHLRDEKPEVPSDQLSKGLMEAEFLFLS